jgi:hypothetical protein
VTWRLALRSLAARPVRTAVLAFGFGFGIAVMAGLLGVGEVILEQAQSPAIEGSGDASVESMYEGGVPSPGAVLAGVLATPEVAGRIRVASPWTRETVYLVHDGKTHPVRARGGVPSLERALGDPEIRDVAAWVDAPGDAVWTDPDPARVLRELDRFHPIPEAPRWQGSWREWLYFNGSAGDARFYLTFLAGPETSPGRRIAFVRLQLERAGERTAWSAAEEIPADELLASAPDLDIGGNRVRLEGLRYRMSLDLREEVDAAPDDGSAALPRPTDAAALPRYGPGRLTGELWLDATPGRWMTEFLVQGAEGWESGYVVPVLSGALRGSLRASGEVVPFGGGSGYHDHNWGFWRGVTWRWGQVFHDDLALVYGRVIPPPDAADAERLPGVLGVLGKDGPLGFTTDVTVTETDAPGTDEPETIRIVTHGMGVELTMDLDVESIIRSPWEVAPDGGSVTEILQMKARYRVRGTVAGRDLGFSSTGAAETFRDR